MIINYTHAFIFNHIPKTAGTSVSRHLSGFTAAGDLDINPPLSPFAKRHCQEFGLRKHMPAEEIREFLGPAEFDRLFKFAFVRNPYQRIYSLYKFMKFNWRSWPGSEIMDRFSSLEAFVASDFFAAAELRGPTGRDSIERLFRSQVFWQCDAQGRLLSDFVGRIEQFEDDFELICTRIGVPPPDRGLDRANVGGKPHGRATVPNRLLQRLDLRRRAPLPAVPHPTLQEAFANPATRQIVRERYAEDFATFGYNPELPRSSEQG